MMAMQRAALFTSLPNAAIYEAYAKIWYPIPGTAPGPLSSFASCSAMGEENPSRLARIMRSEKSASQAASHPVSSNQLQLDLISTLELYVESYAPPTPPISQPYHYSSDIFLPTRIDRRPVEGAYVRPPPPLEIQSPRPTRNYNAAAFLLEEKYASPSYQPPQSPPASPFYPAWPTSSFALYIPSLGIVPSPPPQRDQMIEALLNFNALCLPAFGDNMERSPYPVSDFDSHCPSPSSSLSSPTSGGSPNSDWVQFNSPMASTTNLESNAAPSARATDKNALLDAAQISALMFVPDERKVERVGVEYELERATILALLNGEYEKAQQLVDAGA